jgi:hypothetical protein
MKSKLIYLFIGVTVLAAGGAALAGTNTLIGGPLMFLSVACLAATFYTGYAVNRKRWGLLVPANVLLAVMASSQMLSYVNGQLLAALIIAATGVPFLVLYLLDRSRRWAIATTAVIAVLACLPMVNSLMETHSVELGGLAFFALISLCFFALLLFSRKNWWAIIPGGIMASFGASLLVEILVPHQHQPSYIEQGKLLWDPLIWTLFLGFATTFAGLWLMRKTHPTGWAIYPAAGWLALAVLSFIEGPRFADFWLATMFLVTGTLLLAALIVKVRLVANPQAPHLKGGKS